MFQNPLIQRYRFSLLRPKQIGIYGFIYLTVIVLIFLLNFLVSNILPSNIYKLYANIYHQFYFFQVIILWFWASYNSGTALTTEMLRKTYDFFKLLPISSIQKAFGVLIGTNLLAYSFACLNFAFMLVLGLLANMEPRTILYECLNLITAAFFLNSLTLLFSINPDVKRRRKANFWILLVLAVWLMRYALGIFMFSGTRFETTKFSFFTIKINILLLSSLILLYFTGWILLGIVRKFRYEQDPLFTFAGATLFVIGYEFLMTGLFWSFLPDDREIFYLYRLISFWIILLVNAGALQNVSKYLEISRKIQEHARATAQQVVLLFLRSNLCLGLCLFLIWAICFVTFRQISPAPRDGLAPLANLFGFYLFFLMLFELHALYNRGYDSLKVLLVFMALLALVLPLVLSAVMREKTLYLYSLFGYMSSLLSPAPRDNIFVQVRFLFFNLFLCAYPGFLIGKQYLTLLSSRKQM